MSDTPKVGDKVRLSYEGIVTNVNDSSPHGTVTLNGSRHFGTRNCTIEILEPEYETGQMYVDASGVFYYRNGTPKDCLPWTHAATGVDYGNSFPHRPLTKLVPEGK